MMIDSHALAHAREGLGYLLANLRRGCPRRAPAPQRFGRWRLRAGRRGDISALRRLLAGGERPLAPWVWRLWYLMPGRFLTVAADDAGTVAAVVGCIFNRGEDEGVLHVVRSRTAPGARGQGLATALYRYALASYRGQGLYGLSLLVSPGDIGAMRAAQHAGFAVTKMAVKPSAYYLFAPLG